MPATSQRASAQRSSGPGQQSRPRPRRQLPPKPNRQAKRRGPLDRELAVARERLQLALEGAQLGTFYCDLPFHKPVCGPRCRAHFGLPPDADVSYELFYHLVHPKDRRRVRQALARTVRRRGRYDAECRVIGADGKLRWIRAIGRVFCNARGKPARFDGVTLEVTARKQMEMELRTAKEAAEAASGAKDEFVAMVSHELRTPLNAILGWMQLIQMGALSEPEQREALASIEHNARTQAQLVEDLLDVSRIVSGRFSIDRRPVDLVQVVDAALSVIAPAAQAKGIQVERQCELDAADGVVIGDAGRLQQVVRNLLSNALKFTPDGGRVTVRLHPQQGEAASSMPANGSAKPKRRGTPGRQVVLEITDTGVGIAAGLLPRIFDRFRQGSSSSTRQHGGLGLGLAIAQHIVHMHGGQIRADSGGSGCGATFTVVLPCPTLAAAVVQGRSRKPQAACAWPRGQMPSKGHPGVGGRQ